MKAMVVAIITIALSGCATDPYDGAQKGEPVTNALAGKDKIIRSTCEKEWVDDYPAIAFCVRTQTRGLREVQGFVEEHNIRDGDTTPEAKIFAKCSREWQSRGNPDWTATAFCLRTQWRGYKELNP
ncbi:MAG TPA: hypothetical protein VJP02_00465 [Candidatus Sulfotelmatobacter sp.]|nr:hypothetical protein [Candidatus Sulfotelmatobacter sp.]